MGLRSSMIGVCLLLATGAQTVAQDIVPGGNLAAFEQKSAEVRQKRDQARDLRAYKQSRRRELVVLKKDIRNEWTALRQEYQDRSAGLREWLDRDGSGHLSRVEMVLGAGKIRSMLTEFQQRQTAIRLRQKHSFRELKAEKKKELLEIRDKYSRKSAELSGTAQVVDMPADQVFSAKAATEVKTGGPL